MELPNWFKVVWWLLLTGLLSCFIYQRYSALTAGQGTNVDIVAIVIWIALLLAPLFKEVSIFGITLKQEVKKLKKFVATQVSEIRSDIRNAVDVRTTISPQIVLPPPPSDSQLPELEKRIKSAVSDALASHGLEEIEGVVPDISVSDEISLLFAIRHNIEKEIRRIVPPYGPAPHSRRPLPVLRCLEVLHTAGLISAGMVQAIREVYLVCSPAIHGDPVTPAQVSFVKDVGPQLISALRALE